MPGVITVGVGAATVGIVGETVAAVTAVEVVTSNYQFIYMERSIDET